MSGLLRVGSTGLPEEISLSDALDLVGSAAQGDILYRSSTGWVRLPAGTSGLFLQTLGAGADPAWATPAGGGNVSNSGTPSANQLAQWTGSTVIQGLSAAAEALKYLTDGTPQLYKLDRSAVAVDSNGIFTTVKYYRVDGTLAEQSVLSGGSSPNYTTRTVTRYAADGTTVVSTTALSLTYDSSNNITVEA